MKTNELRKLRKLYKRELDGFDAVTPEYARAMTDVSEQLNRVVAVLADRKGKIEHVMVGDDRRVYLPDIGRQRGGQSRFRGIRLIRTYLKGDGRDVELTRDDLTDLSKLQLDLVVSIGITEEGLPGQVAYAHLIPENPDNKMWRVEKAPSPEEIDISYTYFINELEKEFQRKTDELVKTGKEPAMLAYVSTPDGRDQETEIEEMLELCETAGVEIVDTMVQQRSRMDPKTAMGTGKIEELTLRALQLDCELIVFGQDLSPRQLRGVTDETDLRVIDRTQLILDIFAQRATTRDGKIQVELAQLKYNLPRLHQKNTGMSRLAGGIGGRGPGETKLEINRRRARDRIRSLEKDIEKLSDQRKIRRKRRVQNQVPSVSIVGYTNAGKSTLLRQLATELSVDENDDKHPDLDRIAESKDMLFTTLGTTTRRAELDQRDILLTDTVGFISELPHWLVESFQSTLDSVYRADLVLLVVDASESIQAMREKLVTAHDTLHERNEAPILPVFNKCDRLSPEALSEKRAALSGIAPDPIAVSGKTGEGIDALRGRIESELPDWRHERLVVPIVEETMGVVSWIYDHAHVETESYESEHVLLEFEARPAIIEQARAKAAALTPVESA